MSLTTKSNPNPKATISPTIPVTRSGPAPGQCCNLNRAPTTISIVDKTKTMMNEINIFLFMIKIL